MNKKLFALFFLGSILAQNCVYGNDFRIDYDPMVSVRTTLREYYTKLTTVPYSSPEFCEEIGRACEFSDEAPFGLEPIATAESYILHVTKYIDEVCNGFDVYVAEHGIDHNLPQNVLKEAISNAISKAYRGREESYKTPLRKFLFSVYYNYVNREETEYF